MKEILVAISDSSRGYYSALGFKGLCGIYFRQALGGVESRTSGTDSFLLKVCFLWGQSLLFNCFASFFGEHTPALWCSKSPSISFDLLIHIGLNIYKWPHWRGKAFTFLSRLNCYMCYQLSNGKTVMESKHVLIPSFNL